MDAVYTTLFYAFGQRASLQQQQQQHQQRQLSGGAPWGLAIRGAPPHFAALRNARCCGVEGSGGMQLPATGLQQQEVIWTSIPLADAIELSILVSPRHIHGVILFLAPLCDRVAPELKRLVLKTLFICYCSSSHYNMQYSYWQYPYVDAAFGNSFSHGRCRCRSTCLRFFDSYRWFRSL